MAGRLSGSASQHGRRRRRLAADETSPDNVKADIPTDGDGKPLPTRRPTGRFPLRRVVSRSAWKLAAVGLFAILLCVGTVAGGYVPSIRSGTYGPGVAALCDTESGRLANAVGGLLLLATGQLAWLIRWARARSLRDFRGGYRIWWWTALAFAGCGVAVLTDVPAAFAATAAWLSGRTFFGSDLLYRFLPGLAAVLFLLPALQGDMRGCRTSRTLLFAAAVLWIVGGAAAVAGDHLSIALVQSGLMVPPAAVPVGLLLAGTTAAFTSLLFHARHVVYESVEPPEAPVRRKKAAAVEVADVESEAKPKRAARRSSRTKTDDEPESKPSKVESAKAEAKPATAVETPSKPPRPHFVLKDQVLKDPPKAAPVLKPEPVVAKAPPKPEPPKPAPEPKPAPVAAKAAPPEPEETDGDESMVDMDGRQVRLDGPEDPLRGLSKRERRKLRKESKGRDRHDD